MCFTIFIYFSTNFIFKLIQQGFSIILRLNLSMQSRDIIPPLYLLSIHQVLLSATYEKNGIYKGHVQGTLRITDMNEDILVRLRNWK